MKLSYRAQKLLANVQDSTRYYDWTKFMKSKAMKELEDAGLVRPMGRVTRMTLCFVPVGTEPLKTETFPGETDAGT